MTIEKGSDRKIVRVVEVSSNPRFEPSGYMRSKWRKTVPAGNEYPYKLI